MGDYRIYLLDKANRIGPWWLWGGDDTRHCTSGASDQGTDPGPLPASDGAADCGTAACADQGAPAAR